MAAAGVSVAVFFAIYFPRRDDTSGAIVAAVFALCVAALGFAAIGRTRPLHQRNATQIARLIALSVIVGGALGVANLIANYGIASLDTAIYRQMSEQFAEFSAWSIVVADPLVEEIALRLFLMGGIAWLVSRRTDDRRTVFLTALTISAFVFALAHILPGSRPTTGAVHGIAVVLKTAAAGLVLGWVFWRWGLPYSIMCHSTANAVHLLAMPAIFGL